MRFVLFTAAMCLTIPAFAASNATTSSVTVPPLTARATSATADQLPIFSIGQESGPNPWTKLNLNNSPYNFQFAIVTDRTGGVRPGIFEDAIKKLNLLQPEFVMSVGDLISGYTRDLNEIDRQWKEFQGFVESLTMPFFYVPGNHDLATDVEQTEWTRRIGRKYFHFVYGNVLFLCMNSEDPHPGISAEQRAYFKKALEENQSVRWTLVFVHRPLWVGGKGTPKKWASVEEQLYTNSGWDEFEDMLQGRKYTVFAGHVHDYNKYVRNNATHITLATTGGGSGMRGAWGYGEFDEVAWVTMTDAGPVVANLALNGIWDEDLRTEDVASAVKALLIRAVRAPVIVTEPLPFTTSTVTLRLQNDADIPLQLALRPQQGTATFVPVAADVTVPPNSVEFLSFGLDGSQLVSERQLGQMGVSWTATYQFDNKPKVQIQGFARVQLDPQHDCPETTGPVRIDGKLGEWAGLLSEPQRFAQEVQRHKTWTGVKDCSLKLASRHDDRYVYLAAQVMDDKVTLSQSENADEGDLLEMRLDPKGVVDVDTTVTGARPRPIKAQRKASRLPGAKESTATLRVAVAPNVVLTDTTGTVKSRGKAETISAACAPIPGGYSAEFAIPVALLEDAQGSPWDSFRVNLTIHDRDGAPESGKTILWWKPDWAGPESYPNSGTFVRSGK